MHEPGSPVTVYRLVPPHPACYHAPQRMADPATMAPELGYGPALAYGVIQGVTEFLPISSSGHLKIAHRLGLGAVPPELELPFDVLLHAATLIAIGIAFRLEILAVLRRTMTFYRRYVLAIVPAGIFGLLGKSVVTWVGSSYFGIGACYVFTAGLLWYAHQKMDVAPRDSLGIDRELEGIETRQAGLVGGLQVLALLPGISRSGSTIAAGLIGGMPPELAVAFSFLVGLPLIGAAAAKDALDGGFSTLVLAIGWGPISLAFVASLVSGVASIKALKLVVGRRRLDLFALYCGLVALACFGLGLVD